jgi:esterase/lipase superfamily enzyme
MQKVETLSQGPFVYNRYKMTSDVLKKDVHFGTLRFLESDGVTERPVNGTLYFFHGGTGDDHQGVDLRLSSLIQNELLESARARGLQIVFPFIAVSFLHKHPTDRTRSFADHFYDEVMPAAERATATRDRTRFIGGLSMGGHAALNAFFRNPDLYAGVGAHFPGVIAYNPFDIREVESYATRVSVARETVDMVNGLFKAEFSDEKDYLAHDPIELLKSLPRDRLQGKKVYLDVGSMDDFGLQEGCRILSDTLFRLDVRHQFEIVSQGRHDAPFVIQQFPKMLSYLLG